MMAGTTQRWVASWRIALRVCSRDLQAHRLRSVLIMLMIGLPVLVMTMLVTISATDHVSSREAIPSTMGTAQANIQVADRERAVTQSTDGDMHLSTGEHGGAKVPADTVPGRRVGDPWTTDQLRSLTGGRLFTVSYPSVRVDHDEGAEHLQAMVVPGDDVATSGLMELESGRWPRTATEAVITDVGLAHDLAAATTVTITRQGETRRLRVVGVVDAEMPRNEGTPVHLVIGDPAFRTGHNDAHLLHRAEPMSWAEVQRLNAYGLVVASRAVIEDPPSRAEIGPESQMSRQQGVGGTVFVGVLVGLVLFAVAAMLAGPAFAVSAAQRRHQVALLASNGAESRQVRSYLQGQALVLGGGAAVIGAVLGIVASAGVIGLGHVLGAGTTLGRWVASFGPFQVGWMPTLLVVVSAVIASLVATTVPALGAVRMDVAGELGGRSAAQRSVAKRSAVKGQGRRVWPVVAGALVYLSAGVGLRLTPTASAVVWLPMAVVLYSGLLVFIFGWLRLVPRVLVLVGRLTRELPPVPRLAGRDICRSPSRSVPVVAAIMVTVGAMTGASLAMGAADNPVVQMLALLAAGALVLVATWLSTALSLVESERQLVTMAEVGADLRQRRGIAAAHAGLIALIGTVLGLVAGAVVAVPMVWPYVRISWVGLALLTVVVPLLAAVVAAAGVRREPQLGRRLS